ncbi:MAG: C-type lectin domain-containing protein [Polyangiaceae bacterium]
MTSACTQLSDPAERGQELSPRGDNAPSERDGDGVEQPDDGVPSGDGLDAVLDAGEGVDSVRPRQLLDAGSADAGTGMSSSDDAGSSPPVGGAQCPIGLRFEDSCYRPSLGPLSWQDARDDCLAGGADLVAIDSAGEDAFVAALQGTSTWLGASDSELEGTFRWADGRALSFTNWGVDQPDAFPDQNCVEKRAEPGSPWYDQSCDNLDFYVCERPLE